MAFAGALTSAGGSLTKLGAGTLTLTGANAHTGGTTINAKTLQIRTGATCTAHRKRREWRPVAYDRGTDEQHRRA